jgi:hypothetical protein
MGPRIASATTLLSVLPECARKQEASRPLCRKAGHSIPPVMRRVPYTPGHTNPLCNPWTDPPTAPPPMWTAPSHASKASAPGVRVSTENTEFADDVVTDADEAALLQPFSREYASRPTHHDARRSHHDEELPAECLHSRRERGEPSRHRLASVAHRGRCPRSHRTSVYNRASFGPVAQRLEQGTHKEGGQRRRNGGCSRATRRCRRRSVVQIIRRKSLEILDRPHVRLSRQPLARA